MSTVVEHHDTHAEHHGPPPPPGGWRRLLYPGLLRAAWMTPLFFGIGFKKNSVIQAGAQASNHE